MRISYFTYQKLRFNGIRTLGDIASIPHERLISLPFIGAKAASEAGTLRAIARGRRPSTRIEEFLPSIPARKASIAISSLDHGYKETAKRYKLTPVRIRQITVEVMARLRQKGVDIPQGSLKHYQDNKTVIKRLILKNTEVPQ